MHVSEWARRLASAHKPGNAVADMIAGASDSTVSDERGLPPATVAGVRSFYDLLEPGPRVCDGTACHFAEGGRELAEHLASLVAGAGTRAGALRPVRCLGHCYAAPTFQSGRRVYARPSRASVEAWLDEWGQDAPEEDAAPIPRISLAATPVVLRNLVGRTPRADGAWRSEYDLPDGETILSSLEAAGLRGRGGAAYPTAAKWRAARDTPARARVVVANGDEGDPGSYVDRLLLEEDPHAVLAGVVACARAIVATRAIVYVRAEYPRAQAVVRRAIDQARRAGRLEGLDVEVVSGAGSYVCGEETALLRSIEGLRGEPRPKPPYPAQSGLFGLPTVVQNVETLAIVPWVAATRRNSGTKAVSVSGACARPCVVEVDLGTPVRRILEHGAGGVAPGRRWKMALIGGPLGRVLPERAFDTPLGFDTLPGMGHAGIVVLDDRVQGRDLLRHLFEFARSESCGVCAPCRIGTARLPAVRERDGLERLLETLELGSLCGFGQSVPRPIRDLIAHFGAELFS